MTSADIMWGLAWLFILGVTAAGFTLAVLFLISED